MRETTKQDFSSENRKAGRSRRVVRGNYTSLKEIIPNGVFSRRHELRAFLEFGARLTANPLTINFRLRFGTLTTSGGFDSTGNHNGVADGRLEPTHDHFQ